MFIYSYISTPPQSTMLLTSFSRPHNFICYPSTPPQYHLPPFRAPTMLLTSFPRLDNLTYLIPRLHNLAYLFSAPPQNHLPPGSFPSLHNISYPIPRLHNITYLLSAPPQCYLPPFHASTISLTSFPRLHNLTYLRFTPSQYHLLPFHAPTISLTSWLLSKPPQYHLPPFRAPTKSLISFHASTISLTPFPRLHNGVLRSVDVYIEFVRSAASHIFYYTFLDVYCIIYQGNIFSKYILFLYSTLLGLLYICNFL